MDIGIIIGVVIVSLVFLGLSIWFLWMYFNMKSSQDMYDELAQDYHPGSFKGFWFRNRLRIMMFLTATFLLLSLAFIGTILLV